MHRRAIEINSDYIQSRYNLATLLNIQGKWESAVAEVDEILAKGFVHADYFNLKGIARLWQNRPEEALDQFKKSIDLKGDKTLAFMGIGSALSALGNYRQAEWFFRIANRKQPDSIMVLFLLVDNSLKADNKLAALKWTDYLLGRHSIQTIHGWLETLPTYYRSPPVSVEQIASMIKERTIAMGKRMISADP